MDLQLRIDILFETYQTTPLIECLTTQLYICIAIKNLYAPVAQLDRASDYGSEGLGFESLRVYI